MVPRDGGDEAESGLIRLYKDMVLVRRFEEKAGQLYGMGLIGGFCHLYIGQEAIVAGLESVLRPGDRRITSHRCHAHALMAGTPPEAILAELLGRATGVSGGKGGSMHLFDPERGFFGGHGIVAAQVPLGAGLAFADRYRKARSVTVCAFGDGAADQGQVAETYLLAQRFSLPVVFVIEMNDEAPGQPPKGATLLDRAKSYGLKTADVDGMDVLAVRDAADRAVLDARAGRGPTVLAMRTLRYRGHALRDQARSRSKAALAETDPIARLREALIADGTATEAELKRIDGEIRDRVADAAETARAAPEPEAEALGRDVVAPA